LALFFVFNIDGGEKFSIPGVALHFCHGDAPGHASFLISRIPCPWSLLLGQPSFMGGRLSHVLIRGTVPASIHTCEVLFTSMPLIEKLIHLETSFIMTDNKMNEYN
jgi:hypothetical protein